MSYTYKVIDGAEAKKINLELYEDFYDNYAEALVRFKDGKAPIVIAIDGGEPEDQMFGRDYDAFVKEINFLNDKLKRYELFISNLRYDIGAADNSPEFQHIIDEITDLESED